MHHFHLQVVQQVVEALHRFHPSLQAEPLVFRIGCHQQSHLVLAQPQQLHQEVGDLPLAPPSVTYIPDLSYFHHRLEPLHTVEILILAFSAYNPLLYDQHPRKQYT